MSTYDDRVVRMRFDNSQFERNAKDSISTLDKLKGAMDFSGMEKSMSGVEKSANGLDFTPLAAGIESVGKKFSVMEVAAISAISNISNAITNKLVSSVKSLTVGQIAAGWTQYDASIASQQTIMSAVESKINSKTGELFTLDDVIERIDKLQWYTDETSYNIEQMTNAIGDFTSSGVDLDVATKAILGVSNACADAGVTAEKAGYAYTAFSKAIGTGHMTLGVWNQQLKTSGLTNSEKFKQSVIDAGVAIGTLQKKGEKFYSKKGNKEVNVSNIAENLNQEWLSTEVLMKALDGYSDTVDSIYGLTDDGKLDDSSEVIKNLLTSLEESGKTLADVHLDQQFDTASDAIHYLTKAYEELGLEVPKSLKAFSRAQEATSFSQAVDSVRIAAKTKFAKTYELIFGNYETAKELWTVLANQLYDIFLISSDTRNDILYAWKDLGGQDSFVNSLETIFEVLGNIKSAISDGILRVFGKTVEERAEKLFEITSKFSKIVDKLAEGFKNTEEETGSMYDNLANLAETLATAVKTIFNFIKLILSPIKLIVGYLGGLFKKVEASDFPDVIGDISTAVEKATKPLSSFSSVCESVSNVLNTFYEVAKRIANFVWTGFKDVFSGMNSIFSGGDIVGNLTRFVTLLAAIDISKTFATVGGAIKSFSIGLQEAMWYLEADSLITFAQSMLILVAALSILAAIDTDKLEKAVLAMGALWTQLGIAFNSMYGLDSKGIKVALTRLSDSFTFQAKTKSMVSFAAALVMIAGACYILSTIDTGKLIAVGIAIAAMIAGLVDAFKALNVEGGADFMKLGSISGLLISLGSSIMIIAIAAKILSTIDPKSLILSSIAIGVLMAGLVKTVKSLSGNKLDRKTPKILMSIAASMLILSVAMKIMGSMSLAELGKGLGAVGVALLGFTLMVKYIEPKKIFGMCAGMVLMASSMVILGAALRIIGKMSAGELVTGLVGIAGGLAIMVGAMALAKSSIPGAIAVGIMAAALALLTPQLLLLGTMNLGQVLTMFLALAGSIGVLALAAVLLNPIIPSIVAFAVSIGILGVAIGAAAAGFGLLTTALVALVSASAVSIPVLIAGLKELVIGSIQSIPEILTALRDAVPQAVMLIMEMLLEMARVLNDSLPMLISEGVKLVVSILDGISSALPSIVEAAFNLVITFIESFATSLDNNSDRLISAVEHLVKSILKTAVDSLIVLVSNLTGIGRDSIYGFIEGAKSKFNELKTKLAEGIRNALNAIYEFQMRFIQAGKDLFQSFVEGVKSFFSKVKNAASEVVQNAMEGIKQKFEDFKSIGKNLIQGFIDGINAKLSSVGTAVKGIADKAVSNIKNFLGIHSPSRVFMEIGKYTDMGLARGMDKYSYLASDAAGDLGADTAYAMLDAVERANAILEDGLNPIITPVLDLSQIQNGSSSISSLLDGQHVTGEIASDISTNGGIGGATFNITVYGAEGQSAEDLASAVSRKLNNQIQRRANAWA